MMMQEQQKVTYKVGITGNHYVYSKEKEPVLEIALQIKKSINSVYFNKKYNVWAIRIKNKKQKEILQKIFKEKKED
jgi:hypothetical protein